jgi:hypothetical protein
MKHITTILACLIMFPALSGFSQLPLNPGDTLGIWTVISFDQPTPYITIDPAGNLWQIGAPQKTFFSEAYTAPNAMVTDTINLYPADNHSSFTLAVGGFNMNEWYYIYDIFLDFRHKFDTDTLKDGGYIQVSWDKGITWMNIIHDTVYWEVTPGTTWDPGNISLYSESDTLYNGEFGFSGNSGGWIHTSMTWHLIPVKSQMDFPPDTMLIRFNFISDNTDNPHEGWMIDQIRLFSIDLGSGICEDGTSHSHVAPNPMKTSSAVILDNTYQNVSYELTDMQGRVVERKNLGTCDEFSINRGTLLPGLYLLNISSGGHFRDHHRILVE